MPASIVATPGSIIYPANQMLVYTFATSLTTLPDDFRFVVRVREFGTNLIGVYYLVPNTNKRAHFDLAMVLRDRVERDTLDNNGQPLHSNSGAPILAKGVKNSKGYIVDVGSYTGGSATLNEANTSIVIIDGSVQAWEGLNAGFTPYYPATTSRKVWLTEHALNGTTISIPAMDTDDGAIGFLYNDVTGQAITHVRSRVWNGATIVDTTFTEIATQGLAATTADEKLAGNALGYIKGYPKLWLAYIGYTGAWTKVQHVLTDSAFNPVSSFLEFNRYCETAKNPISRVAFSNSVGGWDYLTFTGLQIRTYNREMKEYQTIPGTWDAATFTLPPSAAQRKLYHMDVTERYSLTRNVDLSEQPLLDALARSKQVMLTIGERGQYLPVKLVNTGMTLRDTANARISQVTLDFELMQNVRC